MRKLWPKYENWSKQENQNRLYRYMSNMYRYKLAKNDQNQHCTGTSSNFTGTFTRKCPKMCVFSHFSMLLTPNHFYTSNTHQNNSKFTLESLFYSIHLSFLIFFQNLYMNLSQYNSNMGYHPYTNQVPRVVRVCSKP